ncbi:hypothetical protein JCM10512_4465 [Bacteroides reticulotermitis JCM 10512]|uniref:Glycosyltransferase n=2 Tax=Bacteroides reticulotermitis TaxID=1133319 RepID=W4UXP7_9BACE|nr:hypothetical protein JCM10512_4465 [Bacteroides reticulotermitis JCM 10512]
MVMDKQKLVILVLSCDGYSDLWDDFFNLRDKYWVDCPYKWYLVTESKDYKRACVEVIKCGKELNWAGRLRKAVHSIDSQYFGVYLEDYFITEKVDNDVIADLINIMDNNGVTFLNTSDVFYNSIGMNDKTYFKEHLIIIPNNKLYGISTESAIWEKDYLLQKIGDKDYSAWQFEIDRVNEAQTPGGLGGFNLCDERMPFHVSIEPVVIQGKIYPAARRLFKKKGYEFLTKRGNLSFKEVFLFNLKMKMANIKCGKKIIKWLATRILGVKFFT